MAKIDYICVLLALTVVGSALASPLQANHNRGVVNPLNRPVVDSFLPSRNRNRFEPLPPALKSEVRHNELAYIPVSNTPILLYFCDKYITISFIIWVSSECLFWLTKNVEKDHESWQMISGADDTFLGLPLTFGFKRVEEKSNATTENPPGPTENSAKRRNNKPKFGVLRSIIDFFDFIINAWAKNKTPFEVRATFHFYIVIKMNSMNNTVNSGWKHH